MLPNFRFSLLAKAVRGNDVMWEEAYDRVCCWMVAEVHLRVKHFNL